MASASSTAPGLPKDVAKQIRHGVAPLRAGQGYSFLLRRLHSLTGIVPVGAFLFEHILISNSTAITGWHAYSHQVSFLANLPLVFFLELFGIWIPIAYHGLYGFYIWYRGDGNVGEYPWTGNWMYTAQRWTGAIAFAYIVWHTWTMRFTGVDLHDNPDLSFGKVAAEVQHPLLLAFYVVGLDRGFVALRLRDMVVLREVGDRNWRQGAEAAASRLPGVLRAAGGRGPGQLVYVRGALQGRSAGRFEHRRRESNPSG